MLITERSSGLFLAEQAAAPAAIRDALKQLDDRLILGQEVDEQHQCWLWKVLVRVGWDRPAVHLFDWRDEQGKPLPLTSRIVDEANRRRLDSRHQYEDALTANDRLEQEISEQAVEVFADAHRDAARSSRRMPVFHRSQGLRMARDKMRARGEQA